MVRQYQLWITTFLLCTQVVKINTVQVATRNRKTILFVKIQRGADRLADNLVKAGVPVGALHGGKSLAVRIAHSNYLKKRKRSPRRNRRRCPRYSRRWHFTCCQCRCPTDHKDYLHCSGRTATAGEAVE